MLKGKTALVTGSTQELGLAMVERLASQGCNIVMNGLGNAEAIVRSRSIVNIASISSLRAAINRVDYVTTKTALIGFTRAVALETAAQNITCNAICPGSSPTPAIE